MKWPFHKTEKQKSIPVPPPKPCEHKYTDIRINGEECWYIDFSIDGKDLWYTIFEPYVCIHCKQRKDVVLEGLTHIEMDSNKEAWESYRELRKQYPQIKDRAVVEDAIADTQLVDRDYLNIASVVMGVKLKS